MNDAIYTHPLNYHNAWQRADITHPRPLIFDLLNRRIREECSRNREASPSLFYFVSDAPAPAFVPLSYNYPQQR